MSNKTINNDDYDLILEEKEKELKKEKRNKVILASSLAALLLIGTSAVAAPIISVAVDKNNLANINNIKIPNTLTFTNPDINRLIDGYKSEIQARKLTFKEFQTDFTNITKKYIVASNIAIDTIVESAKITQNLDTTDFNIEIILDENKKYLTSEELTPATLNKNVLTLSFKENEKLLGDFFTPIEIDKTILDNLQNKIQDIISKNKLSDSNNDLNSIKNLLQPDIDPNQIGNIRYEEPNLIIEPVHPNKFGPSDSNWIVDGNIVIPNLKLYTLIKFTNLQKLFNALNSVIHTNTKQYGPAEFKEYIIQNLNEIKELIYDNLEISNKSKFSINDILNISVNIDDNFALVIELNNNYLKYQLDKTDENFNLNENQLIIQDLDFDYPWSPDSYFSYQWHKATDTTDEGDILQLRTKGWEATRIIIPKKAHYLHRKLFSGHKSLVYLDMSLMDFYGTYNVTYKLVPGGREQVFDRWYEIGYELFSYADKLETVIFPNTSNNSKILLLDYRIFLNCFSLKYVNFLWKYNINEKSSELFKWARSPVTIYVPTQELKTYYEGFGFKNVKEILIGTPPKN